MRAQNEYIGLTLDDRFDNENALNTFFRSDQFPFVLNEVPHFGGLPGFILIIITRLIPQTGLIAVKCKKFYGLPICQLINLRTRILHLHLLLTRIHKEAGWLVGSILASDDQVFY